MKKILLFAYLCVFVLLVYGTDFRIARALLSAPPPASCAQTAAIRTVRVQQVTVRFYCGVTPAQQDLIVRFVGHALYAMPPHAIPSAEVFAFTDLEQGVAMEDRLLKAHGYWPSMDVLRLAWLDKGFLGQSFRGAVFLDVGNAIWQQQPPALASLTVLHEMHHVLQYQLISSNRHAPLWLLEGGADTFAALEMHQLDLQPPARSDPYHCDYSLTDLEYERDGVPLACAYLEGARAVRLLVDEHGQQAYYQLLFNIGRSSSLDWAFVQTYGLNVGDFYERFDAHRRSGYTLSPSLSLRFVEPLPQP